MRGGVPAVDLQRVSKSFGEKPILRTSLQVRAGESTLHSGPQRNRQERDAEADHLAPEADGQIWIEEEEITGLHASDLSRVRRKMGFLFQGAALFDSLTLTRTWRCRSSG